MGQAQMIQAELVQDGGVEVVDVDLVLDGEVAVIVSRAVEGAAFDAAAGQPGGSDCRLRAGA